MEKQQETVEDLKTVIEYSVSNKYTSHDRLLLLGALDASASVAALINREPRLCKSAVFLQAAMDSTETLVRSSHIPEADQDNFVNRKAAQEFSPILHIPKNPPYFPDVLIVDMQTPNDRGKCLRMGLGRRFFCCSFWLIITFINVQDPPLLRDTFLGSPALQKARASPCCILSFRRQMRLSLPRISF